MSLRDQLVQAGLASKDKAKKVAREKMQQQHRAHRDKNLRTEIELEERQRQQEIKAFDEAKRQLDREKNEAIQLQQAKNRARGEAREIILRERLNDKEAEERFNFSSDGKKIRFVMVTQKQSEQLSRGELAICRNDRDGFDYPIVPRKAAERLLEIEKIEKGRWVYFLIDPQDVSEDNDEWAAWDAYEASLK